MTLATTSPAATETVPVPVGGTARCVHVILRHGQAVGAVVRRLEAVPGLTNVRPVTTGAQEQPVSAVEADARDRDAVAAAVSAARGLPRLIDVVSSSPGLCKPRA